MWHRVVRRGLAWRGIACCDMFWDRVAWRYVASIGTTRRGVPEERGVQFSPCRATVSLYVACLVQMTSLGNGRDSHTASCNPAQYDDKDANKHIDWDTSVNAQRPEAHQALLYWQLSQKYFTLKQRGGHARWDRKRDWRLSHPYGECTREGDYCIRVVK